LEDNGPGNHQLEPAWLWKIISCQVISGNQATQAGYQDITGYCPDEVLHFHPCKEQLWNVHPDTQ